MHRLTSLVTVLALIVPPFLRDSPPIAVLIVNESQQSLSASDRTLAFEKVWKIIADDFYDANFNGADWLGARARYRSRVERAKDDSEFYDVLDEMLAELRDSHTSFHRPERYSGKIERGPDVGISVFPVEGKLIVTSVEKDSTAEKANVAVGMEVASFDGKPAAHRLAELERILPRRIGIATERMLTVLKSAVFFSDEVNKIVPVAFIGQDGRTIEVNLSRKTAQATPTMTARRLDSGVGYVRFKPWVPPNDRRLEEQLRRLIDSPALIIDLRGNRGGSFMNADYFLKPGTLLGTTQWRNGKVEKHYSRKAELSYEGKLAVLVDEESGSASENFAAVIQESGRGVVIGRLTCGCFTSSYYESIKGGGRLQWSRALPLTIKGRKVEGAGIVPDRIVPLTLADVRSGRDASLEMAESMLR